VTKEGEIKLPEETIVDKVFEKMLSKFKKDVEKSGVLELVKARRYYRKPSELKRLRANGKLKRSLT
jgi:ribosomal protein S21